MTSIVQKCVAHLLMLRGQNDLAKSSMLWFETDLMRCLFWAVVLERVDWTKDCPDAAGIFFVATPRDERKAGWSD